MRPRSMTKPRKRMIAAGRLGLWAYRSPCGAGHIGPWEAAPEHDEWARRLAAEVGIADVGTVGFCLACRSHTVMPEVAR